MAFVLMMKISNEVFGLDVVEVVSRLKDDGSIGALSE